MATITPEMARAELARRELARREATSAQGLSLRDIFTKMIRESGKEALGQAVEQPFETLGLPGGQLAKNIGYGAIPAVEQIPEGISERLSSAKAGITGQSFVPSEVPGEYGAAFGRGIGSLIGQGIVDAPASILGGVLGGPAGAIAGAAATEAAVTPGGVTPRAIQAGLTAAAPVAARAAGKVVSALPDALMAWGKKITPETLVKSIQARHDPLESQASGLFNTVSQKVKEKGIEKFPVDQDLIESVKDYLPNTKAVRRLLEKAKTGDYDALRDINTELWQRGTKGRASNFISENKKGDEMMGLRDELNEFMHRHLEKLGENDLSLMLQQARNNYRRLMKTYYENPQIAKIVESETREVPENIIKTLTKKNIPTQEFLRLHPDVAEQIETHLTQQQLKDSLKSASGSGAAGLGIYGANELIRKLMGAD